MCLKMITPLLRPIIVTGKLFYEEAARAFVLIRLKRRIIQEFPQLESNLGWSYQLEYHRTKEQTIKRIENGEIPLLVYIYPTKNEQR